MGENQMKEVGVLLTYPFLPYLIESLDRKFTTFKFWEVRNREAFLAEHSHSIRGVACNTKAGMNAELIDALPHLEIVVTNSVGLNNVDLDKCRERNIVVANTPAVLTDDVADLAMALMLDSLRHISAADRYVRHQFWQHKGDYKLTTKDASKHVTSRNFREKVEMSFDGPHDQATYFWEVQNREAFLAEHSHSIRGVACNTKAVMNAELIHALPHLEIVVTNSVGLNNVDLDKCRELNIVVANAPDVLTDDVADLAMALILDSLRHISAADRYVRHQF